MRLLIVGLLACSVWATPTIQTVCASGCTTTNLQTAINTAAAANSGPQIIVLKAGENFDTATGFTLPARSGSYTGWITLRSSRVSELPGKTRVAPADVAKLATLRSSESDAYSCVLCTSGHPSAYWRLEGLEFTLTTTGLKSTGQLIGLGYNTMDQTEMEPSKVSHHFVIDRCYVHGIAFDYGPRNGILANADNVEILNSYISEIKQDDSESHGINGYTFNGPLLVRNTFHGGATIGSLMGGSNTNSATIQPSHMQFLGNHYQGTPTHRALRYPTDPQGTSVPMVTGGAAQLYWKTSTSELYIYYGGWLLFATGITGNVCVDGDFWENTTGPTYFACTGGVWVAGGGNRTITGGTYSTFTHFWSKNRFELKTGSGVLAEGNLIENCFSPTDQSQACSAVLLLLARSQSGIGSTLREIQLQNNLIRRTPQLYNQGLYAVSGEASYTHRLPRLINLENNLASDLTHPGTVVGFNNSIFYNNPPLWGAPGSTGIITFSNQRIAHNTVITPLASSNYQPNWVMHSEGTVASNIDNSDNLYEMGNTWNGASGFGGYGCEGFTSTNWPGARLKNNVMVQVGGDPWMGWSSRFDVGDCQTWAFPWKRTGTGVRMTPSTATILGGLLSIDFGAADGAGSGLYQNTTVKLAGWAPSGLNGTYVIPRLGSSSTSCAVLELTGPRLRYLCLPTTETGAVTPGTIEASADYTDYAAENFRLAATSAYKGWATDGSDPGVDQDVVEWATAGAASGADNPYLDFRVRSITPTADGATFRYTAYSTAACTWTASGTRSFAAPTGAFGSETRSGREGTVTVTALLPNTGYWYRVTCGGTSRDGQFVTTH